MTERSRRAGAMLAFSLTGAAVVALAFGFARFALGQFVPAMRADLELGGGTVGFVGALPFLAFCLASLFAARLVERLGPRRTLVLVLLLGSGGLATMANAAAPAALAVGASVAGLCTGLSMPALAAAVRRRVPAHRQARSEAIMNAGTSAGVVIVAPVAALAAGAWRDAYLLFAAVGLALLPAVLATVPPDGGAPMTGSAGPPRGRERGALGRLVAFSILMGFAAAPFWLFAPERTAAGGAFGVALLWAVLGLAGLAGGAVGDLASRLGDRTAQSGAALLLASGTALAAATGDPLALLPGAAAFGLGYMSLTGLYLVTGTRTLARRPALGPTLPFTGIAAGQAVGAGAAGLGVDRFGHAPVLAAAAVPALLLAAASPAFPSTLNPDRRPDGPTA